MISIALLGVLLGPLASRGLRPQHVPYLSSGNPRADCVDLSSSSCYDPHCDLHVLLRVGPTYKTFLSSGLEPCRTRMMASMHAVGACFSRMAPEDFFERDPIPESRQGARSCDVSVCLKKDSADPGIPLRLQISLSSDPWNVSWDSLCARITTQGFQKGPQRI